MSKETDLALKNLIVEILNNLEPDDILINAGFKPNGTHRRSASASMNKVKNLLGVVSAEAEALGSDGVAYKKTFIKDISSVEDVRTKGRTNAEGVKTPLEAWKQYELLSYFFELYYSRMGSDFPLETPGVKYLQFVKSSNKWVPKVTRGLATMSLIIKTLGGIEQAKAYIDWWFTASFSNRPVSWGWLASSNMISMFQGRLAAVAIRSQESIKDSPLPEDFVSFAEQIPDLKKYVSVVKTHKQLKYTYNAWAGRMEDQGHPVIKLLTEAVARGLIKELS